MAENQFVFSARSKEVAQRFVDAGFFKDRSDVAPFAAAYILRTQFETFDPATFSSDKLGTNYAYGTLDPDGRLSELVSALYKTDSPRQYVVNLMVHGLEAMGDVIDNAGGLIQISDFI